jgi:hypothetical protein
VHVDAFQPEVLREWETFLELYVAERVPVDVPLARSLAPMLYDEVYGVNDMDIKPSRFLDYATRDEAVAAWKAEPPLRALFESGAGGGTIGEPIPTFERSFSQWPATEVVPTRLYADRNGDLVADAPTQTNVAPFTFHLDPAAGQKSILAPGGDVWDILPDYAWAQPADGSAVIFESTAMTADTMMFGTASVDLWLRAPVDDADLEINITEIRPDGQEMFVQSGWLRASLRGSGPDATELYPAPAYTEELAAPLVPGEWTQVRVGTAGIQHVFRTGSKIRVSIDTPGGSRAEWFFANKTFPGDVVYEIGHDADHPSSVVFPVIPGATVPAAYPPCPSLRGQQCREYVAYRNTTP